MSEYQYYDFRTIDRPLTRPKDWNRFAGHLARVVRHLLKRARPVQMLRAADKPDFGFGEIDHGWRSYSCLRRTR